MAKLGHPGYGLCLVEGTMLLVSPTQVVVLPQATWFNELDTLLRVAEEDHTWVDHKINRSLLDATD